MEKCRLLLKRETGLVVISKQSPFSFHRRSCGMTYLARAYRLPLLLFFSDSLSSAVVIPPRDFHPRETRIAREVARLLAFAYFMHAKVDPIISVYAASPAARKIKYF